MDIVTILVFVVLVVLSAFFSSSEIGIMSVPKHLIESLVKQGNLRAKKLLWLKERTDKLLITILIGNNLINTFIAALATKIAIDVGRSSGFEEGMAVGVATGIITLVLLLFGEILPKTMATRLALPFGLFIAPIYTFLVRACAPLVWLIEKFIRIFDSNASSHIRHVTHEEVEALVDIAKDQGSMEEDMARNIKKMIDFHDTSVEEIITPRIHMEVVASDSTVNETIQKMNTFSHTRIPVYTNGIDDIEWLVSYKEMIVFRDAGQGEEQLKNLDIKKAYKIPLTMPLDKLIEVFRKERNHLAIVMDEYGGVAGMVTLEDVIEDVFGDFLDDTDTEVVPIVAKDTGYLVQPGVSIDNVLDILELDWHEIGLDKLQYGGETLSYLVISKLERFPHQGEIVSFALPHEENSEHKQLSLQIKTKDDNSILEIFATTHSI